MFRNGFIHIFMMDTYLYGLTILRWLTIQKVFICKKNLFFWNIFVGAQIFWPLPILLPSCEETPTNNFQLVYHINVAVNSTIMAMVIMIKSRIRNKNKNFNNSKNMLDQIQNIISDFTSMYTNYNPGHFLS